MARGQQRGGATGAKRGRRGGAGGGRGSAGRGRSAAIRLLVLIVILGGAYFFRVPLLRGLGAFLVVEDEVRSADLIVLLPGDVTSRPFVAAALYRRGLSPRVVSPRVEADPATRSGLMPHPSDVAAAILAREGVPASAILLIEEAVPSSSTVDDARVVRNHLLQRPAERILLVTSDYHTRRARWIFRRELKGLGVDVLAVPSPHLPMTHRNWWTTEAGWLAYGGEYLKMVHTFFR